MTKADIVREIAASTGLEREAVLEIVEQFMRVVKESVADGESVCLRGFGSFGIKQRAQKTARNIAEQKLIVIPAHNIPAFKPSPEFKAMIR